MANDLRSYPLPGAGDILAPDRRHPCHIHGLPHTHVRVFHAIVSGFDRGHNPNVLRDLMAHDLIRERRTPGYFVPYRVYAQWSEWAEQTARLTLTGAG
jgi:hypothetical protein